MTSPSTTSTLVVRRSADADAAMLEDLARLDSSLPLAGPALVAEVDGTAVAALSLWTGRHVADPFVPTGGVVDVLRVRAEQLGAAHRHTRRLPSLDALRLRTAS